MLHVGSGHLLSTGSALKTLVLLYVGPDQILPLTSALGAILGVLLMFWQRVVVFVRKAWQFSMKKLGRSADKT